MVIKVFTSGISGNKEVKKRQQRIMMILESKNIEYEAIDITEPGNEDDKHFMQDHATANKDSKHPLPPQIFNELEYCGDYEGFDVANENDELEVFLKIYVPPKPVVNGTEVEHSAEKDTGVAQIPERQEDSIDASIPNDAPPTNGENVEDDSVHGFCYTPGLAKRLELALKSRMRRKKTTVRGYCYTPSLADRLTKAMEKALARKNIILNLQPSNVKEEEEQEELEEEQEPESAIDEKVNEEEESNENNDVEVKEEE